MPQHDEQLAGAAEICRELRERPLSLMLATVGRDGFPGASYAPFVRDEEGNYYIFVSRLSAHTRELLDTPKASILLIKDEADTAQIFARPRITYTCSVLVVARGDPQHERYLDRMAERFGNVVSVLRSLPDFVMFKLVPRSGRLVTGFGQAYDLIGDHLDRLAFIGPDRISGETSSDDGQ